MTKGVIMAILGPVASAEDGGGNPVEVPPFEATVMVVLAVYRMFQVSRSGRRKSAEALSI